MPSFHHVLAAALALPVLCAQAAGVNDTGTVLCGDASSNSVDCSSSDPSGYPRQDGRFGRAAMDAAGVLYKIGASSSLGFDFTKIANNGTETTFGLGDASILWACTRDNVTGLTWEVKSNQPSHLRRSDYTYTWYDTDTSRNGNGSGSVGTDTCNGTLSSSQCNTAAYIAAVNAAQLCGYSDWRLPRRDELFSISDSSKQTDLGQITIDGTYFPYTGDQYWTSTPAASSDSAWTLNFGDGFDYIQTKASAYYVRLVRGAQ